ncbi:MAG: hypothetical protein R2856_09630 [Caldilineaceae bacterium]
MISAFGLAQLLWTRLEEIEDGSGVDHVFQLLVEAAEIDPISARGRGRSCVSSIIGLWR